MSTYCVDFFYRERQKGKREEGRKGDESEKKKIIHYKKYNKCSITLILLDPMFKSTLFRKTCTKE